MARRRGGGGLLARSFADSVAVERRLGAAKDWPRGIAEPGLGADHHRNAGCRNGLSLRGSLFLFQGGEAPARRGSIGLGYSFDKRVFRQVFVVLSYDCLGLL